ncbi:MAG TPA: vWA domain-containing protein [Pirellulales bacterium]|nr:vWA domain-containing protein [Pirellulales bacterium]
MAEEFILDCKVDQPHVLAGKSEDLYALVTIRPNIAKLGPLLETTTATPLPAHLVVVVDVSGSMNSLIRDDPNARVVSRGTSDGRDVTFVESSVPTRREVAQQVVERLAAQINASDRMTLIAFDHLAYPLASCVSGADARDLKTAVAELSNAGGGGTSMGRGFQAAINALGAAPIANGTSKVVVLTDGEDQEPEFAVAQARVLAEEHHVPIHAFGTGDCRGEFLTEICKTTMGGKFSHIKDDTDAERDLGAVLQAQKNILATNVTLSLWLSPELFVRELYRTKPEVLYVGSMSPDASNCIVLPIEYMEKGSSYEFLFQTTLPAREAGRRFRIAKATLTYDIPALDVTQQKSEANIAVEYTVDAERAMLRIGEVRRVIAQAEVQRQVLFLQSKIDALNAGRGTEKDRTAVAKLIDLLIGKYEDFSDQANANSYRKMRDEFLAKGTISQEMLNRSLAASSKVEEAVGVVDIDDF